jgi:ribosomal protein L16 Arg81 hydroxylase
LPELIPDVSPRLAYARPNWMSCILLSQRVPDGLVEFFVGGPGSAFPKLHVDTHGTHAFITQLKGKKRIVMAAPSETEALTRALGNPEKFSMDLDPDILERLNMVTAILTPGDTLFIPAGWWHVAYMSELSISVSTNLVNASNWPQHVRAVTKHTEGLKKPLKAAAYHAIGMLLSLHDIAGAKFLYRHYD